MRIWIIQRGDDNIGFCPVIETARLTEEEAETYVAEQERMALGVGDEASYWTIVDVEMPLSLAREMATPAKTLSCDSAHPPDPEYLRRHFGG
jgi:hypothetical protein